MNELHDILIDGEPTLQVILDEYVDAIDVIPKDQGRAYFAAWSGRVDPKLIRQTIYAGIYYAMTHPDKIKMVQAKPKGE